MHFPLETLPVAKWFVSAFVMEVQAYDLSQRSTGPQHETVVVNNRQSLLVVVKSHKSSQARRTSTRSCRIGSRAHLVSTLHKTGTRPHH
eukprot:5034530-Amphidinium_carterae.2